MRPRKINKIKRATTIMEEDHYKKLIEVLNGMNLSFSHFSNTLLEDVVLGKLLVGEETSFHPGIFQEIAFQATKIGMPVTELMKYFMNVGLDEFLYSRGELEHDPRRRIPVKE